MNLRIGNGYDVHRLVSGRSLILGGVLIPHETGLLGHSDADVLIHAIMDSLLGASKMGDIGVLFPDTKKEFENISSLKLLRNISEKLKENGFEIINIDSTIIAQKPKLRPYIEKMEENIANCLNINKSQINIKATTEEGLGFTGNLEGISANAVCLLNKIKP